MKASCYSIADLYFQPQGVMSNGKECSSVQPQQPRNGLLTPSMPNSGGLMPNAAPVMGGSGGMRQMMGGSGGMQMMGGSGGMPLMGGVEQSSMTQQQMDDKWSDVLDHNPNSALISAID